MTMANILAYLEFSGAALRGSALSAIAAARKLAEHHGGGVTLLLVGKGAAEAAARARAYAPRVVVVDDPRLEHVLAETYAPVIAAAVRAEGAPALVATATAVGKDILPRVATLLDAGMASDISGVVSRSQFLRPVLAGGATATVEVTTPIVVVSARQAEFAPAGPLGAEGQVATMPVGELPSLRAEFVGVQVTRSARPELTEAKAVVSGGRGMKNGDNFKHIEELADAIGAAVGASRAATDAGYVPADLQVGQTGKVVAPELYIAVGISGAIQHLAGMKGSKVIVAINKDPEAPIFQVADYGMVTTWEKVLPELTAAIKKHRQESR
jgi:electron transfer flavoprotein alpha subunit